ncbi:MAG: transcription antitermination factor NusB [Patescibacteria group bacterium]|nr:transcription antitermination factor NusB [Patescibacteria group bacterium]
MDKFNRKKTRKLLFQILFSETFNNFIAEDFYESFFNNTHNFIIDEVYMEKMVKIIKNYEYFFIHVIKKYSPKFDISKMSKVNIIPLYIAISEMFIIEEEIPVKVSINEAVELAKTY